MHRSRFALLPVLLLLLALPLAADVRTAPTADGPPPSVVEGTITSLHAPIVGEGPIVSLLGGLVSFDATGAAVRFANGAAGTAASLAVGHRIAAFVDPASSPLKASSIVVFEQRSEVSLTGPVQSVDPTAKTLTLLGFTVLVNERTVFGGPWDGAGQAGLGDVKAGDLVLVAAKADGGGLLALKVMKLSPAPTPTVRLHGVVASIGTESWTITLRDGQAQPVKVDARTRYVGDPKVGDQVDVVAQRQSDGSLLAVLIAKVPPAVPVGPVTFEGVVASIVGRGSATGAAASVWTVDATKVLVTRATTVKGSPTVGDRVRVTGMRAPDGSVAARLVEKI